MRQLPLSVSRSPDEVGSAACLAAPGLLARMRRIHMVGIGGTGMSGIALLLRNLGFVVTGSDVKATSTTENLERHGINVQIGHRVENAQGADVLVYSSAIAGENPEVVEAQALGIPVIRRAEMLAELMRMKSSIAIAGTHGKTTVTSLVAAVLLEGGLDPTTVIGGRIMGTEAGARLGKSEFLVAEADESDRSFLLLLPTIAVITNIEREHMDVYRNLGEIKRAFLQFANRVPFYGAVVAGIDSPAVRQIYPRLLRRRISYGLCPGADLLATKISFESLRVSFDYSELGRVRGRLTVNLAGRHNVQNALAALAIARELGVSLDDSARALANFPGVHRRLELQGERAGITVYDDYGHHPTEIAVTLRTLRHAYPSRRLVVVFQPHRYSRTKFLAKDFGAAFECADYLLILPIYAASEPFTPGVTNELIAAAVRARCGDRVRLELCDDFESAVDWLVANAQGGDVVITQGAGNIWEIGRDFLARL